MVAAADPMATPTMVPLTPKNEAIVAATTAPATEARTCRMEILTIPRAHPSVTVSASVSVSAPVSVDASASRPGRGLTDGLPNHSIPHGPVDAFAQQIGVAVVAGVLLNHVRHDPPQITGRPLR